jgi:hypothetical protein
MDPNINRNSSYFRAFFSTPLKAIGYLSSSTEGMRRISELFQSTIKLAAHLTSKPLEPVLESVSHVVTVLRGTQIFIFASEWVMGVPSENNLPYKISRGFSFAVKGGYFIQALDYFALLDQGVLSNKLGSISVFKSIKAPIIGSTLQLAEESFALVGNWQELKNVEIDPTRKRIVEFSANCRLGRIVLLVGSVSLPVLFGAGFHVTTLILLMGLVSFSLTVADFLNYKFHGSSQGQ